MPCVVEHLADVVRVHAVDDDAHRADPVLRGRRAEHPDPGTLGDAGEQPRR